MITRLLLITAFGFSLFLSDCNSTAKKKTADYAIRYVNQQEKMHYL
jgi:hypothetical protein